MGIQLCLNGQATSALSPAPSLAVLTNHRQHHSEVEGIIHDYVKTKANFLNAKKMNINRLYKQTLIKDTLV